MATVSFANVPTIAVVEPSSAADATDPSTCRQRSGYAPDVDRYEALVSALRREIPGFQIVRKQIAPHFTDEERRQYADPKRGKRR